jgi:hypothetical protein
MELGEIGCDEFRFPITEFISGASDAPISKMMIGIWLIVDVRVISGLYRCLRGFNQKKKPKVGD